MANHAVDILEAMAFVMGLLRDDDDNVEFRVSVDDNETFLTEDNYLEVINKVERWLTTTNTHEMKISIIEGNFQKTHFYLYDQSPTINIQPWIINNILATIKSEELLDINYCFQDLEELLTAELEGTTRYENEILRNIFFFR